LSIALAVTVIVAVVVVVKLGPKREASQEGDASGQVTIRALRTQNSSGRSGAYFIPSGARVGPRPLLVLFHGTGEQGSTMAHRFLPFAQKRGIVMVAPDSRRSPDGNFTWQVSDEPNDLTDDFHHTLRCLEEVLGTPNVVIDSERVLAAGYSGGGSSAPYFATNERRIREFAVLHGGVFATGLGPNRVRGWFSTGEADTARSPEAVRTAAASAGSRVGAIEVRTYPGGHELSERELTELVEWWLDR
jgi:predicted esterase